MVRLLLHELSDDLHILLLSQWLDVRSLVTLDVAVSSNTSRPYWMTLLGSLRSSSIECFLADVVDTTRDLRIESTDEG